MPKHRLARAGALALALALSVSLADAAVVQRGDLRITVLTQVKPYRLPRTRPAPIAVFVSGHLAAVKGGIPPQLRRMSVEVNRHGLLQSRGLPVCGIARIQPATSEGALAACGKALIGSGQFWAHIVLPGQAPYPTRGRLLIFNGRRKGRSVLLAHIFTSNPFFSSFVFVFSIHRRNHGPYGTELSASFPQALGDWGYVDRIKLTLRRRYRYRGKELSYFNAACPAPRGSRLISFPLAYASFYFAEGRKLGIAVNKACGVRG